VVSGQPEGMLQMGVRHYSDLIAWQKAVDLVVLVYQATDLFPKREMFGLANQMRRAAVSVPSNIAEGQGRRTSNDFCHFLSIARGSLQELETQTVIAARLKFIEDQMKCDLLAKAAEVARIINGLIASISG
jgi:four helix bundle protein